MSITFHCTCGKKLKAADEQAGRRGKCSGCGIEFVIPLAEEIRPAHEAVMPPGAASAVGRCTASPMVAPTAQTGRDVPTLEAALPTEFDSRRQILSEAQVVPDASRCVQCGICSHNCPMGIDVRAHAWRGKPIHDSRCLTCSECVRRCPRGVLQFEQLAVFAWES